MEHSTSTLKFKDKFFYKINRRLIHKTQQFRPLKTTDGNKVCDKVASSELFEKIMEFEFTNLTSIEINEVTESIEMLKIEQTISKDFITSKDISEIIKRLPLAKASREDGIPNWNVIGNSKEFPNHLLRSGRNDLMVGHEMRSECQTAHQARMEGRTRSMREDAAL